MILRLLRDCFLLTILLNFLIGLIFCSTIGSTFGISTHGISPESMYNLKGYDKYNNIAYGFIPFNQMIINFEYHFE